MRRSSRIGVLWCVLGTVASAQWRIGAMSAGRTGACAAQLPDGRVLIAGGLGNAGALDSAEIFDSSGAFTSAAPMSTARSAHACVTMDDGRVLAAGGANNFAAVVLAEIYDPVANRWSPAGEMAYGRSGHTATLLKDGRVLIAGGEGQGAVRNTIELFEPGTNSFHLVSSGALSSPRKEHGAALLREGRVLIVGGSDGAFALDSSDLFDPATDGIAAGPKLAAARAGLSATTLLDGSVLIAGGNNGSENLMTAEIYDPVVNKVADGGRMTAPRRGHLAFLLPNNNQVLLVGGDPASSSAELFTSWLRSFGRTGGLGEARSGASGAALGIEGALMVAGGRTRTQVLQTSGLYRFPTLKTDRDEYPLGSGVNISGSGWQPGERVSLSLEDSPKKRDNRTMTVNADGEGNISASTQASGEDSLTYITAITAQATSPVQIRFASTGANLDQCANGPISAPLISCNTTSSWVNGNLGSSKAHYLEGESIPYRLTISNVSVGPTHTLTVEWDTTQGGKHALDYVTSYNRPQAADPCVGVSSGSGGSAIPCLSYPVNSTFAIPPDPNVTGAGVTPDAGNFTLFGGTITGITVPAISSGSYAGNSSTKLTITFTASVANPVLAWGGHIATRLDWGSGNSAIAISGSPYHMRLLDLDGSGGNQDRSLSSDAAIFPGTITIIKSANPQSAAEFPFTAAPAPLSNFSLYDDGTPNDATTNTKVFSAIQTFQSYTISETTPSAWTPSFPNPACTVTSANGGSASTSTTVTSATATINLKEGENWTCTFVNTAKTATVKLQKSLSPTNDPGRFDLTVNSTTTLTNGDGGFAQASVAVGGTATLSEAASAGNLALTNYTAGLVCPAGITVSNNVGTSGSFTVPLTAAGTTITCTVTNTRKTLTLTLKKTLSPGTDPGTFDLKVGTSTVKSGAIDGQTGSLTVNAGDSVSISEAGHTGTTLSFYGSVLGCDNSVSVSANNGTSGTIVVPAVAGPVTCTFTNTRKTLTLIVKKSVPTANDPGLFDLSIAGSVVTGANGVGNNGTGQQTVNVGGSVSISEAAHSGTSMANYGSTLGCSDNIAVSPNNNTSGTITVPNIAGPVTCTFTNTNSTAKLTVQKVCAAAANNASFGVAITPGSGSATSFNLLCDGSQQTTLAAGTYVVSEPTVATGFTLAGATGQLPNGWTAPGRFAGACDSSGQVILNGGDNVTCYILNVANYCAPQFPPTAGAQPAPANRVRRAQPSTVVPRRK